MWLDIYGKKIEDASGFFIKLFYLFFVPHLYIASSFNNIIGVFPSTNFSNKSLLNSLKLWIEFSIRMWYHVDSLPSRI